VPNAKFYEVVGRCEDLSNITKNPNCSPNAYVEAEIVNIQIYTNFYN